LVSSNSSYLIFQNVHNLLAFIWLKSRASITESLQCFDKDWIGIVITTGGTYTRSFVTQVFLNLTVNQVMMTIVKFLK
jgi:hypothetical protein